MSIAYDPDTHITTLQRNEDGSVTLDAEEFSILSKAYRELYLTLYRVSPASIEDYFMDNPMFFKSVVEYWYALMRDGAHDPKDYE